MNTPHSRLAAQMFADELAYSRAGYSTILVRPREKWPLGAWAEYQKWRRTEAEVFGVRRQYPLANIGIVCEKLERAGVDDSPAGRP